MELLWVWTVLTLTACGACRTNMAACVRHMSERYLSSDYGILYSTSGARSPNNSSSNSSTTTLTDKITAQSSATTDDCILRSVPDVPVTVHASSSDGSHVKDQCAKVKVTSYILSMHVCDLNPELTDFKNRLRNLASCKSWNNRAKFIVIVIPERSGEVTERNGCNRTALIRVVLDLLRQRSVVNVIIVMSRISTINSDSRRDEAPVDVFTWFPYIAPANCGTQVDDITLLDTWTDSGVFLKNSSLFPNKVPPNLQGCPVTVNTHHWPPFSILDPDISKEPVNYTLSTSDGVEVRLMKLILNTLNISAITRPLSEGSDKRGCLQPNGKWSGLYGEVMSNRTQVVFGGLRAQAAVMERSDATVPYASEEIVWFIPREKPIPSWLGFYRCFSPNLWLVIMIVYLTSVVTMWLLSNACRVVAEHKSYKSLATTFAVMLLILLGHSVERKPRSASVRVMFLFAVLYSLEMTTAYNSSLVRFLTNPGYERAIRNEAELVESGLHLGFRSHLKLIYSEADEISTYIYNNFVPCENFISCIDRMANKSDLAVLAFGKKVRYLASVKYMDERGVPKFYNLARNVLSYNVRMFLTRGNLLLERFDSLIRRVVEGGILEKWWRDYTVATREVINDRIRITGSEIKIMKLSYISGPFFLLCIGLTISSAAFIAEVVVHEFHRRRRRIRSRK